MTKVDLFFRNEVNELNARQIKKTQQTEHYGMGNLVGVQSVPERPVLAQMGYGETRFQKDAGAQEAHRQPVANKFVFNHGKLPLKLHFQGDAAGYFSNTCATNWSMGMPWCTWPSRVLKETVPVSCSLAPQVRISGI